MTYPNAEPEDRRSYLSFIQAIIARMASEANTLKAWLVPVATATYGFTVAAHSWVTAALGVIASLVLGFQGASYLRQERAFRLMYNEAVKGNMDVFDLNPGPFLKKADPKQDELKTAGWISVLFSWSVLGFFGVFALVGVILLLVVFMGLL